MVACVETQPVVTSDVWAGLFSAMLGSFPAAATFWTTYEATKQFLAPFAEGTPLLPLVHMAAAAAADVAVCTVRNPFEVVKQQMQVGMHSSMREAVKTIIRVDGIRGLYAGYSSTVVRYEVVAEAFPALTEGMASSGCFACVLQRNSL